MEELIPTSRVSASLAEYFELAEQSEVKLEYHDGEVVAMAGGTESHSLITTTVIGELRSRLKDKPCRVYDSNLRVTPSLREILLPRRVDGRRGKRRWPGCGVWRSICLE